MTDRAGNKKRNKRNKCLILVALLALGVIPARAAQNDRVHFGIYAGWSQGLGRVFRWRHMLFSSPTDVNLNFHSGAYVQYDLSQSFGLQLNVNYQGGVYRTIETRYDKTTFTDKDALGALSVGLNGVLNCARVKNTQLYFLGGAGIFAGNTHEFDCYFLDLQGGPGIKIFFKRDSRSAINLGGTFHHLVDLKKYGHLSADYLRFQIGYEFCPK